MDETYETALAAEAAEAVAAVALMAAFADGQQDRAERARLEEIFTTLGGVEVAALYRRVMLEETTLEAEAAKLRAPELQTLAFETALSVCDADGVTSQAEGRFLGRLQAALSVPAESAAAALSGAEQLAAMPVERPLVLPAEDADPRQSRVRQRVIRSTTPRSTGRFSTPPF